MSGSKPASQPSSTVPDRFKTTRARLLGQCIECKARPNLEGFTKCTRCRASIAIRYAKDRNALNLRRRLRKANRRLLQQWVRCRIVAEDCGEPPPPPPQLFTYIEPKWGRFNRLREYRRRRPKTGKRYKYSPRPLPKPSENVIDCVRISYEGVVPGLSVDRPQNESP